MHDWFPDWSRDIVVIVASGPSANKQSYEEYRGKARFVAVNKSWKLVPWADVLLSADAGFWLKYKGVPDFVGLKITMDWNVSRDFDIKLLRLLKTAEGITIEKPGYVGMGKNSGFYAVNFVVQCRAKKIILAGFDMNPNGGIHWHGPHEKGLNNPSPPQLKNWAKILDAQSGTFQKLGVKVINTSATSSLKAYPKMSLKEAFEKMPAPPVSA